MSRNEGESGRRWTSSCKRLVRRAACLIAGVAVLLLARSIPALGAEACPNEQLRAQNGYSLTLPDCRAYEQVSPTNKQDGDVVVPFLEGVQINVLQPFQASVGGDAIVYEGDASSAGNGTTGSNEYLGERLAAGWGIKDITPVGAVAAAFSRDLSAGLLAVEPQPLESGPPLKVSAAPEGYRNIYLRLSDGGYVALNTETPMDRLPWTGNFGMVFAGASADLGDVVFQANDALTGASASAPAAAEPASEKAYNLYAWAEGQLRLVNVLPGNASTDPNAVVGSIATGEVEPLARDQALSHAVSNDGSRVFWTALDSGKLYVRQGGTETVEVDASRVEHPKGPEEESGGGVFWTASADGSKVFFTDEHRLTGDSTAAPGSPDLYEYDVEDNELADLSAEVRPGEHPGVQGVVGTSEDGSYVYFVANGVLARGASLGNCHPLSGEGECNLYLQHEGKTTFIATLSGHDDLDGLGQLYSSVGVWRRELASRGAEVAPNGHYLAFMSKSSLTGYDNIDTGAREPLAKGRPDYEVYLYSAAANRLVCASCNPDSSPPAGASYLALSGIGTYQPTYLTEDGTLFFSSQESLVPGDTNRSTDAYEYESGHIYLISGGKGAGGSYLDTASPNGENVFFTTWERLVPQDQDEQGDLYDARVSGGFPAPASGPTACTGEGCRGTPTSSPSLGAPASQVFSGPGNVAPTTESKAVTRSKPLTRAQKLARALVACKKDKQKKKRVECEKSARNEYGAKTTAKQNTRRKAG